MFISVCILVCYVSIWPTFSRNRLMLRKKKMRVVVIFLRKMLVVFFFCYNFVSFLKHKNCFIIKI